MIAGQCLCGAVKIEVDDPPKDYRGVSLQAAQSYAEMTGTVIDEKPRPVEGSIKGTVTIQDHVRRLIPR